MKNKCTIEGCEREINARGLCGLHYSHAQKNGLFGTPCCIDGCNKPVVGMSLCSTHYAKKKRSENRERYNEYQRKYNKNYEFKESGKKKRSISYERYRKNNLKLFSEKEKLRRNKKRSNGGSFSKKEWMELLKLHNGLCVYCKINPGTTVDHIIPISRGGTGYISNIVPACLSCNCSKQNKLISEWR